MTPEAGWKDDKMISNEWMAECDSCENQIYAESESGISLLMKDYGWVETVKGTYCQDHVENATD